MSWIKKGDQIINLELVSEIYKQFDRKYLIKFKLSDSMTTFFFANEEIRDNVFNEIQEKLDMYDLDI